MAARNTHFYAQKKLNKEHDTADLKVSRVEKSQSAMGTGAIVEFLIVEEDVRYGFLANSNQHMAL